MNPLGMPNADEEIVELSEIHKLMDQVKNFDCDPSVFKVYLIAADHMMGFDAVAEFRSGGDCSNVEAHADDPEMALTKLLKVLETKFSRCPMCGGTGRKP